MLCLMEDDEDGAKVKEIVYEANPEEESMHGVKWEVTGGRKGKRP